MKAPASKIPARPACRHARQALALAPLFLGLLLPAALRAQDSAPAQPPADDVLKLPSFSVTAAKDDSFIGKEAMSTTRTGVALRDLPQSVVTINNQFLKDAGPIFISDLMKFVGGGQTGTLTWSGSTRYMMRGFASEGNFVDGFNFAFTSGNTEFYWVDHVEVIKGPSSIFVTNSAGTVGGVVNKVSKSPTSYFTGELSVAASEFDRGVISADVSGPITKDQKLQYRVLLSANDYSRYWDRDGGVQRWSVMPMLAYDFSPDTRVWVKFEKNEFDFGGYEGIPLDGRTKQMAVLPGGDKGNLHEDTPLNYRHAGYEAVWGQLTSRLSDWLALRLAAFQAWEKGDSIRSVTAPSGSVEPTLQGNGTWAYLPYPQYVIPPTYQPGQLIPRNTTASLTYFNAWEIQNDYVASFKTGPINHTFLLGGTLRGTNTKTSTYSSSGTSTATSSAVDPFNPNGFPGTVFVDWNQPAANTNKPEDLLSKIYFLETASMLDNRVILTFGGSQNNFKQTSFNQNYNQRTKVFSAPTVVPNTKLSKDILQWGAVFKPLKNVSVFYGYNANFAANAIVDNQFPPPQEGKQTEIGVKASFLDDRLNVTVAWFDIKQLNNPIKAFPQTTPPSNVLVPGVRSRGFDGDFSFQVTKNFTLIGSFALFDATAALNPPYSLAPAPYDGRIYTELPVNNVSEQNFSLWGRYKFEGALKGLSASLGVSRVAKRAITDNANFLLYGYIPGYTMVDGNLSYTRGRMTYTLSADNVLNTHYTYASRSNQVIVPGHPINLGGSITYRF